MLGLEGEMVCCELEVDGRESEVVGVLVEGVVGDRLVGEFLGSISVYVVSDVRVVDFIGGVVECVIVGGDLWVCSFVVEVVIDVVGDEVWVFIYVGGVWFGGGDLLVLGGGVCGVDVVCGVLVIVFVLICDGGVVFGVLVVGIGGFEELWIGWE